MNDKKRKIFIISLITITVIVLIYIVYIFMGNRGNVTTETSGNKIFNFGSLLTKKKTSIDGSKTQTGENPIDIGGDTNPDPTTLPGDTPITNLPDTNQNPDQIPSPNLYPLPDPGVLPNSDVKYNPDDNPIDITKFTPTTPTEKKKLCDQKNLPKDYLDIICAPGGVGTTLDPGSQTRATFTLNDAEQAELDRLNRMFARLAPYLKTEADIAREKSNAESYEDFNNTAIKLSRETDIEVASSSYKGPKNVKSPFLTDDEFEISVAAELKKEVFGTNNLIFAPLGFAGIAAGKLFDILSDSDKTDLASKVGNQILERLATTIDTFVTEQLKKTTGITINKDSLPCKGSFENCRGSAIFEKTLDIY